MRNFICLVVLITCIRWTNAKDGHHDPHGKMADEIWSSLNHWFFDEIKVYIQWFVAAFNHVQDYVGGAWHKLDVASNYFINYVREEDCAFHCRKGMDPIPNDNYTSPDVGCTLFGFEVEDRSLPNSKQSVQCCRRHVWCYSTCNKDKNLCDDNFVDCLNDICNQITLADHRHTCQYSSKLLQLGSFTFGCRLYRQFQRDACLCKHDEL